MYHGKHYICMASQNNIYCYPQFTDEKPYLTSSKAETQNQDCVMAKPMLTMLYTSAPTAVKRHAGAPLDDRVEELCQSVIMLNPLKCQTSKFLSLRTRTGFYHRAHTVAALQFYESILKALSLQTI